jgi:hypothetical protein
METEGREEEEEVYFDVLDMCTRLKKLENYA